MHKRYMKFIQDFLDNQSSMAPKETGATEVTYKDNSLKAVIFDIYGTLLISSSGDIEEASLATEAFEQALIATGLEINADSESDKQLKLNMMLDKYRELIALYQKNLRTTFRPYPEIEIRDIFKDLMLYSFSSKFIKQTKDTYSLEMLIIYFELLSNKIYEMPNLVDSLSYLSEKNVILGIVSNAQFYTHGFLNYYLEGNYEVSERIKFFDSDISVFSYKYLRGKPDTFLFNELNQRLKSKYNINPDEAVFVGNDMLKDIYTASETGMKTALFAGDKRSLRIRSDDERTKNLKPDFVLTDLNQIKNIL